MLENTKSVNRIAEGHGTHVVGSMVGSVKGTQGDGGSVGEFSGMAPEAKLVFFDLLAGPGGDGLDVPDALEEDYFNWAYQHGALLICLGFRV
jgi:serine protease AprX